MKSKFYQPLASAGILKNVLAFTKEWTIQQVVELFYVISAHLCFGNFNGPAQKMRGEITDKGVAGAVLIMRKDPYSEEMKHGFVRNRPVTDVSTVCLKNSHGSWKFSEIVTAISISTYNWEDMAQFALTFVSNAAIGKMMYAGRVSERIGGKLVSVPQHASIFFRSYELPEWVSASGTSVLCPPLRRIINKAKFLRFGTVHPDKMTEEINNILPGFGRIGAGMNFGRMDDTEKVRSMERYMANSAVVPNWQLFKTPLSESHDEFIGEFNQEAAYMVMGLEAQIGLPLDFINAVCTGLNRSIVNKNFRFKGLDENKEMVKIKAWIDSEFGDIWGSIRGQLFGIKSYGAYGFSRNSLDLARQSYTDQKKEEKVFISYPNGKREEFETGNQVNHGFFLGSVTPDENTKFTLEKRDVTETTSEEKVLKRIVPVGKSTIQMGSLLNQCSRIYAIHQDLSRVLEAFKMTSNELYKLIFTKRVDLTKLRKSFFKDCDDGIKRHLEGLMKLRITSLENRISEIVSTDGDVNSVQKIQGEKRKAYLMNEITTVNETADWNVEENADVAPVNKARRILRSSKK